MKAVKFYNHEMMKQFGYFPTWLPSTPVALGDVGIWKEHHFTKISNLSDFGIDFEIEHDLTKSSIDYKSQGVVSVIPKLSGAIAPKGSPFTDIDAGISVEIGKEFAVLFKALGTTNISIKDQVTLGTTIKNLYKEGKWDKKWLVITEMVKAESATVIISNQPNSRIDLKTKSEVKVGNLDIADAELGLEIVNSKGIAVSIIANESLTPLFKVSKVKVRLFGNSDFEMREVHSIDLLTPEMARKNEKLIYFDKADFEIEDEEEYQYHVAENDW